MLRPLEHPPVVTATASAPRAATPAELAAELQRALAEADLQREMLREGRDTATAARLAHALLHAVRP